MLEIEVSSRTGSFRYVFIVFLWCYRGRRDFFCYRRVFFCSGRIYFYSFIYLVDAERISGDEEVLGSGCVILVCGVSNGFK